MGKKVNGDAQSEEPAADRSITSEQRSQTARGSTCQDALDR